MVDHPQRYLREGLSTNDDVKPIDTGFLRRECHREYENSATIIISFKKGGHRDRWHLHA